MILKEIQRILIIFSNLYSFKVQKISGLNFNNYATRKTISQGLLNVTLLTTNATQLKRVLTSGNDNQFYTLLVWLIGASIFAQV